MSNVSEKCESSSSFALDLGLNYTSSHSEARSSSQGASYVLRTLMTSAPLMAADLLAFTGAMALASTGIQWVTGIRMGIELLNSTLFLGFGLFLTFLWFRLYPAVMMKPAVEFRNLVVATSLTFACYVMMAMSFGDSPDHRIATLLLAWLLTLVLLTAGRSLCRSLCAHCSWWGHQGLVIGRGEDAHKVYAYLNSSRRLGLRPVAVIDVPERLQTEPDLANKHRNHWLVFAGDPDLVLGGDRRGRVNQKRDFPRMFRNTVVIAPEHVDARAGDLVEPLERVDLPDVQQINSLPRLLHSRAKRLFDILTASLICLAASPVFIIIAGLLKFTSPGPILYRQARIGLGGRHFSIYKFRTMEVDADAKLHDYLSANPHLRQEWELNQKLEHDPRITRIGRFMRKTSLDELPQIWNVLMGDMSFVGPRPIVDAEIQRYGDSFDLYKQVPPGITGLWQVYGRNKTTYVRRVQLDAFYVENWSLMFDLYILFRTFKTVLYREGAC